MKQNNFQKNIDVNKYQIFICTSPTSVPLVGFLHTYIIANCKGVVTRWDVWHIKNRVKTSDGFVHKNTCDPWIGLNVIYACDFLKSHMRWHTKIIGYEEGYENSLAYNMCTFINENAYRYPFKDKYRFIGPNSNTFVQWFLDHFPKSSIILPWRAVGKSFNCSKYINNPF